MVKRVFNLTAALYAAVALFVIAYIAAAAYGAIAPVRYDFNADHDYLYIPQKVYPGQPVITAQWGCSWYTNGTANTSDDLAINYLLIHPNRTGGDYYEAEVSGIVMENDVIVVTGSAFATSAIEAVDEFTLKIAPNGDWTFDFNPGDGVTEHRGNLRGKLKFRAIPSAELAQPL